MVDVLQSIEMTFSSLIYQDKITQRLQGSNSTQETIVSKWVIGSKVFNSSVRSVSEEECSKGNLYTSFNTKGGEFPLLIKSCRNVWKSHLDKIMLFNQFVNAFPVLDQCIAFITTSQLLLRSACGTFVIFPHRIHKETVMLTPTMILITKWHPFCLCVWDRIFF